MAQDQNESHGVAHVKPDFLQGTAQGTEVNFFPPLAVPVDAPELRYAKLSRVVAEQVVPRLLALHEQAKGADGVSPGPDLPRASDIEELANLVLGSNDEEAAGFILGLKDGGVSLDSLHLELLEPTARHLGELWNQDLIDFVDVTLGVARLQRLVHVFEGLDDVPRRSCARPAGMSGPAPRRALKMPPTLPPRSGSASSAFRSARTSIWKISRRPSSTCGRRR
jgi:hypothetical protein